MGMKSFLKYPKGVNFDGEDADESITYVFRKSLLTTIPWLVLTFCIFISPLFFNSYLRSLAFMSSEFIITIDAFLLLVGFGYAFQNFVNWYFNVYIITNKKIVDIDFHGFIYKNISEAYLRNVEDVTSNVRGALGIIFNIGDVYIQTAGETREFEFTGLDTPARVRDIISDLAGEIRHHGNT